ncbi:MAG: Rieske 2Fe-2S domain-containing protein [Thaumarchaeota archaeon]|nr:Rieske 2Fe-2S domain-containing protein [Nitrososphaerota archaeon]
MNGEFIKVTSTDQVPIGSMKTFTVGREKVLIANVDGKYYAIGAICTHRDWDLSEGTLNGKKVVCMGHPATWDLETGQAQFVLSLRPLAVYEVKAEGNSISIRIKQTNLSIPNS